jgi:hypothetical protein
MGETAGKKELQFVLRRKFDAHVLAIGWRTFAKIEGHIQDPSLQHADELCLSMWFELIMQAADDPVTGEGLVVLDKADIDTLPPESLFIIGFKKITPLIFVDGRFEKE